MTDHDQIFKTLIQAFFREFVELFLPHLVRHVDFGRVEFLRGEMFTDLPRGERRSLDLVVKVGLRRGGDTFIVVHVEFESQRDPEFPERFAGYFMQLYLRYRRPVVPVAVFTDDAVWRVPLPSTFRIEVAGQRVLSLRYRSIKLRNMDWRRFLRSRNPLAFALMAKMGYDRKARVRLKAEFLRLILGAEQNPARKSLLVNFVETYMPLSGKEERDFERLVESPKYEEVTKMITVYEKKALRRGRREGRAEGEARGRAEGEARGRAAGLREACRLELAAKMAEVPPDLLEVLETIGDLGVLASLLRDLTLAKDGEVARAAVLVRPKNSTEAGSGGNVK